MTCSVCGETSDSEVNFCRKCGTSLKHQASDTESAITQPMTKENAPFFPQTGAPVVPIGNVNNDEMTVVKQQDYLDLLGVNQSSVLPEESINFTIDESFFNDIARKAYQTRGLLRLKESYMVGSYIGGSSRGPRREIKEKHIDLLFAARDDFKPKDEWEGNYQIKPKTMIEFRFIESVTFKRGLFRSKLIVKLEPESTVSRLKADPIIREIVFNISWKDAQLAKRLQSAIMMEISNEKLRGILAG